MVRPLLYKLEAIKVVDAPTKVHEVYWFVGITNYYTDILRKCAHTLDPLTKLWSTKVKLKWTDIDPNSFMEMNKIVSRYSLLSYPNFIEEFIIHADPRKTQLGIVIIQNWNPIVFYSHKLTPENLFIKISLSI